MTSEALGQAMTGSSL